MEYYDTFDENGVFQSSEDEYDVHYKGLWHKVIRVWLYDNEGNIYLRVRKEDNKLDCINQKHMLSLESISSCFDRAMFDKLGIHFPATSNFEQASLRKVKIHKVFSDNSELQDNFFLCDYIGEFDNSANFFIFSKDTTGLVKVNAKGILGILNKRTGEVVGYNVSPNSSSEEKRFIRVENIFDDPSEDTYMKYSYVVNTITNNVLKYQKEERENEKIRKLATKQVEEEYVSHADENEGDQIY
jgi:hypothetical protein